LDPINILGRETPATVVLGKFITYYIMDYHGRKQKKMLIFEYVRKPKK
jgi:hypothetical protein